VELDVPSSLFDGERTKRDDDALDLRGFAAICKETG
jgi:hypothetical protein